MPGKRKVLLKRLKDHKTIWHPESTLVFKSQKERLIIGRYSIETEELISLDDITLELCNEWKFIPDPELLIRTGGESRLSNFLLWQLSYAEIHFTKVMWPEFRREEFLQVLHDYQQRERRFGRTGEQIKGA